MTARQTFTRFSLNANHVSVCDKEPPVQSGTGGSLRLAPLNKADNVDAGIGLLNCLIGRTDAVAYCVAIPE